MNRIIKAFVFLLIICIAIVMPSCNNTNNTKNKTADKKYYVNTEFDPYRKSTVYDNLDYYGYYDFIDFYNSIDLADVTHYADANHYIDYDYEKDVDPRYLIDESEDGFRYKTIDSHSLSRDFYPNYKSAVRKSGDYLISDFKDGVCLHKIAFDKKKYKSKDITVEIPSSIDGKKVLKLSGYILHFEDEDEYYQTGFLGDFTFKYRISLKIPSTVTEISDCAFDSYLDYNNNIVSFEVDSDSKNFSSKDGVLYSKTKDWLFRVPFHYNKDYVVPDTVKYIACSNFSYNEESDDAKYKSLTVGKNVKRIYDDYCDCNCKVFVYKDSYAAHWFEKNADKIITTIEYIN